MKILAITGSFPTKNSYRGIFLLKTLVKIAELGHEINVIAPQKFFPNENLPLFESICGINVYRPKFISLSSKRFFGINTYYFTLIFFIASVLKLVKKLKIDHSMVYSHFLCPSGLAALLVAKKFNLKAYCVLGESDLVDYEFLFCKKLLTRIYRKFQGVIFNSEHSLKVAASRYRIQGNRRIAIPNGVDTTTFFAMDKIKCRKKIGFPLDKKIVIFVGGFEHRKGPLRVLSACKMLKPIPFMVFIGKGKGQDNFKDEKTLHVGPVDNNLLPTYLSSADVFVLPTLSEGMPNALIEAMACNLPIVTSSIEPNIELLGDNYHLFCDPMKIESIAQKISSALANGHCHYTKVPTIKERAKRIIDFINKSLGS